MSDRSTGGRTGTGLASPAQRSARSALRRLLPRRGVARAELEAYRAEAARLAAVCREAARGDLEVRVLRTPSDPTLGELARAINQLLDLTDAYVRESGASLEHASEGRFYRRVLTRGLLGSFRNAAGLINGATARMRDLAEAQTARRRLASEFEQRVQGMVERVAAASTESHQTALSLGEAARGTDQHAASVAVAAEQTSRSMEAIGQSSREVAELVGAIERTAHESTEIAGMGVTAADRARVTVRGLEEASRRIDVAVHLISGIAAQTRLLALNAAIEAARAGEVGQGFAVVADEVKTLAARTADATREIGAQVEATQRAADEATRAIAEMAGAIGQMHALSLTVTESVRTQRTETVRIAAGVDEVAVGSREVSSGIAAATQAAQGTSAAASQMMAAAAELSAMAEGMRDEVDRFVTAVRDDGAASGGRRPRAQPV